MIFVGDIWPGCAIPPRIALPNNLHCKRWVGNLESGLLDDSDGESPFCAKVAQIASLREHYSALSISNNHVGDRRDVGHLRTACEQNGITVFGGGGAGGDALRPATLVDDDGTIVRLLSFGWSVIGCRAGSLTKSGVAPLSEELAVATVRTVKSENPKAKVVVYLHWGYELDVGPQPAHRSLAIRLLDEGADAVIGSHSHNVQSFENIDGKFFAHSLGNWLVPQGREVGGANLFYPEVCRKQAAVEIRFSTGDVVVHKFTYEPALNLIRFEEAVSPKPPDWGSASLVDWKEAAYEEWYCQNRRQVTALPVFRQRDTAAVNALKTSWIHARHVAARIVRGLQGNLYNRK